MNNIILNIPFGNYNAYTLLDTINSLMTENNILGTLTLDISNGKYLLTATQNIIIRTTTNNINSIIGLDNSTYTTINNGNNFKIYFPYPVNTGGIHNIFIKSNFSTSNQKYGGNNTSQILKSIPIQVEPFGIIQYSNYENTETIIRNKDLDSLIIELLDDNLNHINFNGLNWTIGLEIKSVNKFNPNDTNIFSWE